MKALLTGLVLGSSVAASAQNAPTFSSTCPERDYDGHQERFCETRDLAMPAPTGQSLVIDGGTNGSVNVQGWDGADVRIRATVQTWGDTQAQAQARAKTISVSTTGNTLRAMPINQPQSAVSFEVFVPRRTALALTTHNGSISLTGLQATVQFHAQNGGIALADLGGQVSGNTVNGALSIRLSGSHWQGNSLDVTSTNGSITWHLPATYSAQFFTSTGRGDIQTTLPVKEQNGHYHEVDTTLNVGGQSVKAVTTNGDITIKQG